MDPDFSVHEFKLKINLNIYCCQHLLVFFGSCYKNTHPFFLLSVLHFGITHAAQTSIFYAYRLRACLVDCNRRCNVRVIPMV